MIDFLIKFIPLITAVLYFVVGVGYGIRKEWAWCLVWMAYSLANVGLVLAALPNKSPSGI